MGHARSSWVRHLGFLSSNQWAIFPHVTPVICESGLIGSVVHPRR